MHRTNTHGAVRVAFPLHKASCVCEMLPYPHIHLENILFFCVDALAKIKHCAFLVEGICMHIPHVGRCKWCMDYTHSWSHLDRTQTPLSRSFFVSNESLSSQPSTDMIGWFPSHAYTKYWILAAVQEASRGSETNCSRAHVHHTGTCSRVVCIVHS